MPFESIEPTPRKYMFQHEKLASGSDEKPKFNFRKDNINFTVTLDLIDNKHKIETHAEHNASSEDIDFLTEQAKKEADLLLEEMRKEYGEQHFS